MTARCGRSSITCTSSLDRRRRAPAAISFGSAHRCLRRCLQYAGATDVGESEGGSARGQSAEHGGGRVRPRRDGAHPQGEAWGALDEAGHRHRALQGSAVRGSAQASHERQAQDAAVSAARVSSGPREAQAAVAVGEAQPGGEEGAEEGASVVGLSALAVAAGAERFAAAAVAALGSTPAEPACATVAQ